MNAMQRRLRFKSLLGYPPGLDETLPVDHDLRDLKELADQLEEAYEEERRLHRLIPWSGPDQKIVFSALDPDRYYEKWCDAEDRHTELEARYDAALREYQAANRIRIFRERFFNPPPGVVKFRAKRLEGAIRGIAAWNRWCNKMALLAIELCRSAIARCVAVLMVQALLDLVASLASRALDLVHPQAPPRILSAGGILGLFVPRW